MLDAAVAGRIASMSEQLADTLRSAFLEGARCRAHSILQWHHGEKESQLAQLRSEGSKLSMALCGEHREARLGSLDPFLLHQMGRETASGAAKHRGQGCAGMPEVTRRSGGRAARAAGPGAAAAEPALPPEAAAGSEVDAPGCDLEALRGAVVRLIWTRAELQEEVSAASRAAPTAGTPTAPSSGLEVAAPKSGEATHLMRAEVKERRSEWSALNDNVARGQSRHGVPLDEEVLHMGLESGCKTRREQVCASQAEQTVASGPRRWSPAQAARLSEAEGAVEKERGLLSRAEEKSREAHSARQREVRRCEGSIVKESGRLALLQHLLSCTEEQAEHSQRAQKDRAMNSGRLQQRAAVAESADAVQTTSQKLCCFSSELWAQAQEADARRHALAEECVNLEDRLRETAGARRQADARLAESHAAAAAAREALSEARAEEARVRQARLAESEEALGRPWAAPAESLARRAAAAALRREAAALEARLRALAGDQAERGLAPRRSVNGPPSPRRVPVASGEAA